MGVYVSSLVAGGLVGRDRGRARRATSSAGAGAWAASPCCRRPARCSCCARCPRSGRRRGAARSRAPSRHSFGTAPSYEPPSRAAALFFTFVGTFTFVTFRLERAPFGFGDVESSLVFLLWLLGAIGPFAGRFADRVGWRAAALTAIACATTGLVVSLPALLPTLVVGLGLMTLAMFSGATALQLGVLAAADADRGAAAALYFCVYYTSGALGAYLPGLAWQAWGWKGVAACGLGRRAHRRDRPPQLHGYGEFETGCRSPVAKRSNRNG